MSYGRLTVQGEFELMVVGIFEDQTQFNAERNGNMLMHCHHIMLEDEDHIQYQCQTVEAGSSMAFRAQPKDMVHVRVTAFSRNIHTIEFIRQATTASQATLPETKKPPQKAANIPYSCNPPVGNTAAAIALKCAIDYFADHPENEATGDTVEKKREEYYDWLVNKHYGTK